jgi:hypothetical protein
MVGAYGESLARYEETEKPTEKRLGYVLNILTFNPGNPKIL